MHSQAGTAASDSFLTGGGEMGKLIRSMDWSKTPLGPIGQWPQSLRTAVSLCISSNFPISMAWGPDHVQIYNDGYWPICGGKHPASMGQDFTICWASAMPVIGDAFNKALAGESQYIQNQRMFLDRNGYLEETFFTFSFSPIRDETGGIGGLFHPVNETTSKMLVERRNRALRDVSDLAGAAKTVEQSFSLTAEALREHELDLPFVLFYAVDAEHAEVELIEAVGLERQTAASPERARLTPQSDKGWPFAQAINQKVPFDVSDLEQRFGKLVDCGPYPEPPARAQILPIWPPGADKPRAFVVVGASARLPFDDEYASFFRLLTGAITAAVANAEAYEQERKRAEALAELDRAKTAFFSNVSHEFRTPLTLMLGPLDAVAAEPDVPADMREKVRMAQRNGQRLLKLVNTLLDFSRIEAGRAQASYQPTDLSELTIDLASSFRSACEHAGLALRVDCPPLSEDVWVDREMWEKVVLNLISNAFKFTFGGEIAVTLSEQDGEAVLEIRDTGVGIVQSELPKIFERFHRVMGAKGRTYEGSGIGLALVKEVVKLHGGEIAVASQPDEGTVFSVRLPFGSAHLPQDRLKAVSNLSSTAIGTKTFVEEAMRWLPDGVGLPLSADSGGQLEHHSAPRPAQAGRMPRRARILWADDNADMRDYIRRLLGTAYDVDSATDGVQALSAARANPPDLVLSDVMMPNLDGFGLIAALRADQRLCTIPVILLSARAGEESRVEGLEAGASDYLVKPFSERELLARIEAQLALADLRRQVARGEALSEEIFRSSVDGIQLLDLDGRIVTGNDAALGSLRGQEEKDPQGAHYVDLWTGAHRQAAENAIAEAVGGAAGRFTAQRRGLDGNLLWWDELVSPVLGADGKPERLLVISRDITEIKLAEKKRNLLLHELNHRVKNTLATVQSIASQTLRDTDLATQSRRAFERRLSALANSHDLLTRQHWESAELGDLVRSSLRPFLIQNGDGPRFDIKGPAIELQPGNVLALGLVLHELATNAAKYGALSEQTGTVDVHWRVENGRLSLRWQEKGGPVVTPPSRKGFGSRLIEAGLGHQLSADVRMDFHPKGLVCEIGFDLPRRDEADGPED